VEDPQVLNLAAQLYDEEQLARDMPEFYKCNECRSVIAASCDVQQPQVLWTDGAASNNQDDRFRRAGAGIFYKAGHDMNLSMMVLGLVQTNQRAELLAVVVACLRDPRPLHIRTDSEYVRNGFACWESWVGKGWDGAHADLWNLLAAELRARQSVVSVSWVKGHAKQIDVDRSRTTQEDKTGNDGADALAVAGACLQQVPAEVLVDARERKEMAVNIQRMMITILQARAEAECNNFDEAVDVDRGSEMGDCMPEFLDDEFDFDNGVVIQCDAP
jgi:ribonuclease HI